MAIKKSELYSSLWKGCDELRGGMDASQYKDYVLVLLFVKYVSDRYAGNPDGELEVPPEANFSAMVDAIGKPNIGERLNIVVNALAKANPSLKGAIDLADFDDDDKLGKGKEMVDRLSNLVAIFNEPALDFRSNRAEGDDLLGDAYEYLMRNFATESGKSKGQFYTPAEVSRILAKVIGAGSATRGDQTIHDPTCGSGSLLLKAHDEARSQTGFDLALYGQEMDNATAALARMNMILHDCATAEIHKDNTLASPHWRAEDGTLKTFDFVVSNPPFSFKKWSTGVHVDADPRFKHWGPPPEKNGDYAFLLHVLACLKSTGKGAIILPHGVLFRGNAEATIRKRLVQKGYIKGIIGLPPNLFYGTGIPACIIVLDKENAHARKGIFMIDASRGFIKDGNKNRLREQDIHRIVDTFTRLVDVPKYARMVPLAEISDPKNDFNLNLPRHVDSTEPEDLQDIDGHLRGGIPDRDLDGLAPYWAVLPSVRVSLFESAGRPGYSRLRVPPGEVKAEILAHPEFLAFRSRVETLLEQWTATNIPRLQDFGKGGRPKALIHALSEDILATFANVPLLDAYDLYQRLMDYWAATMQDDAYLISHSGWLDAAKPRRLVKVKGQKSEEPDFVVGKDKFKSDLVPRGLLVARYLARQQAEVDELEARLAALWVELDERLEEHGGEGGLLEDVVNGDGDARTLDRVALDERVAELKAQRVRGGEEWVLLTECAGIQDRAIATRVELRAAAARLEGKIAAKYGELREEEVKALVVADKWVDNVASSVRNAGDAAFGGLVEAVIRLAAVYGTSMSQLSTDLDRLTARVSQHLAHMGAR